jgi:hypothetical protein
MGIWKAPILHIILVASHIHLFNKQVQQSTATSQPKPF